MCEYSERIFNGGREEGIKVGRREGLREGSQRERQKMIGLMRAQGVDEAIIAKILASITEQETVKI